MKTGDRSNPRRIGRREVMAGALGGALVGCSRAAATPKLERTSKTIRWKAQSHHPTMAADYEPFARFCASVGELSEGQLTIEPHMYGDIVPIKEMFDAVKTGRLDVAVTFPVYADISPATSFLTSYPLGLDRPDQWETWYYGLGGLEIARRVFAPHGVYFLAPLQQDLNVIHARIPIRSFEDFRGRRLRMPGGLIAAVFEAAGAKTVFLTGDMVYPSFEKGTIDAADGSGPATNFTLGFANVAKYIILGPPSTPSFHQPVDLHCILIGQNRWNALPPHLQDVVEYAARRYSWNGCAREQGEDVGAWDKFKQNGVELVRLSTRDIEKLRRVAIPTWFEWARKDPLAREAFESQLAYLKNPSVAYVTDDMLVDTAGTRLTL